MKNKEAQDKRRNWESVWGKEKKRCYVRFIWQVTQLQIHPDLDPISPALWWRSEASRWWNGTARCGVKMGLKHWWRHGYIFDQRQTWDDVQSQTNTGSWWHHQTTLTSTWATLRQRHSGNVAGHAVAVSPVVWRRQQTEQLNLSVHRSVCEGAEQRGDEITLWHIKSSLVEMSDMRRDSGDGSITPLKRSKRWNMSFHFVTMHGTKKHIGLSGRGLCALIKWCDVH